MGYVLRRMKRCKLSHMSKHLLVNVKNEGNRRQGENVNRGFIKDCTNTPHNRPWRSLYHSRKSGRLANHYFNQHIQSTHTSPVFTSGLRNVTSWSNQKDKHSDSQFGSCSPVVERSAPASHHRRSVTLWTDDTWNTLTTTMDSYFAWKVLSAIEKNLCNRYFIWKLVFFLNITPVF